MKKYLLITVLLLMSVFIYAQDGAEHKISNIIGAGSVEINIGKQFEIKIDDVFQIFGKGQIIHPATGKLVERDNIYLGKIKVIEVKELSSVAEIIEKKGELSVGNKIVKVVSAEQEVIENKRPVQAEFENPTERNYSETIYTQKDKKAKSNKDIHIIDLNVKDNNIIGIINKGSDYKIALNNKYAIYVNEFDTSSISGNIKLKGIRKIGVAKIESVEYDVSNALLEFDDGINLTDTGYIIDNNILQLYKPIELDFDFGLGYSQSLLYDISAGIDWYPQFDNLNDYIWIGANLTYLSFPYEYNGWYTNQSFRMNLFAPSLEIGFSPLRNMDRNKSLFFGFRHMFSKKEKHFEGSSLYTDGSNYDYREDYNNDLRIKGTEQIFIGYQFNKYIFIESCISLTKTTLNKNSTYYLRPLDDYWPYEWALANEYVGMAPYEIVEENRVSLSLLLKFGVRF